jgi:hypothetical protein
MGCDIHAHIEFFSKTEHKTTSNCFVRCFSGELSFGRDYILFGLMAGVRHSVPPIIKPKGIPTTPTLSYEVTDAYYLNVISDEAPRAPTNSIRESLAKEYVSEAYSIYVDDSKLRITNPNFHTPTWLTLDELLIIRKMYLLETVEFWANISKQKKIDMLNFIKSTGARELMKYSFPDYENSVLYAAVGTMMSLERVSENADTETRLVCWFDS